MSYTRLFEEAGVTPPKELTDLAKTHHRIERMTRGDNLANLDVLAIDAAQITQKVKAAAQKDADAERIAKHWSQTRMTAGWGTHERGWVAEIESAANRVFLQHADGLIEARQAEFDKAVSELAEVTELISASPDADSLLQEGTEEQTDAYQRREAILDRLADIHSWRLEFIDSGYGANRAGAKTFLDDVMYEAVVWFLDSDDPNSVDKLELAEEIWADTRESQGNRFAQLLEQGYSLRLNTAADAGAIYLRRETVKQTQRQETEAAVQRFQTEKEVRNQISAEREVLIRNYGRWADVPQEERDQLAQRQRQLLDDLQAGNVWEAVYS